MNPVTYLFSPQFRRFLRWRGEHRAQYIASHSVASDLALNPGVMRDRTFVVVLIGRVSIVKLLMCGGKA
jgi:hypothetical protein